MTTITRPAAAPLLVLTRATALAARGRDGEVATDDAGGRIWRSVPRGR